jgi:hypothetical protein
MPGPRQYTDAPELTSSRLPTIHLSKSIVTKVLRHQPLQVRRRQTFFSQPLRFRLVGVTCSAEGGGIISFVPPLSIGCREDFCPTFTSR